MTIASEAREFFRCLNGMDLKTSRTESAEDVNAAIKAIHFLIETEFLTDSELPLANYPNLTNAAKELGARLIGSPLDVEMRGFINETRIEPLTTLKTNAIAPRIGMAIQNLIDRFTLDTSNGSDEMDWIVGTLRDLSSNDVNRYKVKIAIQLWLPTFFCKNWH